MGIKKEDMKCWGCRHLLFIRKGGFYEKDRIICRKTKIYCNPDYFEEGPLGAFYYLEDKCPK